MPKFQVPTGMRDLLPDDMAWYERVEAAAKEIGDAYGFGRMETPILEHADLFVRGVGAATDIVEKEMYIVRTRGGDRLALRPEGTAPFARAYLEHGMRSWPQPVKLWYFGPMFRHERPQAGRFRQFWHVGFELIGIDDPAADAEAILVSLVMLSELGLKNLGLQVNSIGCSICRPIYRKLLVAYLRTRQGELCANCRRRLKMNPLRVLDCKEERCERVRLNAPEIVDHLCEACRAHLRTVLEYLEESGIAYLLNPRLVRGLDYYTRTVFEIFPEGVVPAEAKAQSALGAGGRYDELFRSLGVKAVGAVGVALGVERIIAEMKAAGVPPPAQPDIQVFVAQLGEQAKRKSPALFEELRRARFRVRSSFGRDSIKSQLRIADKLGVPYVIIVGQKEVADGTVILRSMQTGAQETVRRDKLISVLRDRLRRVREGKERRH